MNESWLYDKTPDGKKWTETDCSIPSTFEVMLSVIYDFSRKPATAYLVNGQNVTGKDHAYL